MAATFSRTLNVIPGRTYCYRVVALMVRRSASNGRIYEEIESIPSEEACVQLPRDIPLLTRVDVVETSPTEGQIDICWLLPDADVLDTLQNPGPYRYVLSRATGQTVDPAAFESIATFEREFFAASIDTCFTRPQPEHRGHRLFLPHRVVHQR